jgi:alginate O-acetyltransferase complex protein AlgI
MKIFCQTISERTEMTENYDARPTVRRGWVFYDGQCRYCVAAAQRGRFLLGSRGFEFVPLQTPWVQRQLGLNPADPLEEMKVLTTSGQVFGGADAILFLARQIWWAIPLSWLGQSPFAHRLVDRAYRWIAAHRTCQIVDGRDDLCRVPLTNGTRPAFVMLRRGKRSSSLHAWSFLIILPWAALLARSHVAPWIFMWLMAGAIFLGCKWLTFRRAITRQPDYSLPRVFGYLFLWAGMDAPNFFGSESARDPRAISGDSPEILDSWGRFRRVAGPSTRVACAPILKILFGAVLVFILARHFANPLLAGWIGMIGFIFLLHFGLFDLAAVAWRAAGVQARPIMNAPIRAISLTEFWGRRWNGAFNQLVLEIFFVRLARKLGAVRATLTAFLVSGLIHELVISLPAGAGYGLPTSYFLLQGWGIITQRTPFGKRWGLRRGVRGWLFTMTLTAGPAVFLFHPPFVRRVVLPFMQAIGAL